MALQAHARGLMRRISDGTTNWSMIGPQELATVIGKLDRLKHNRLKDEYDGHARPGSLLTLLDLSDDCLIQVQLTVHSRSDVQRNEVSIFSPLGCALLSTAAGAVVSVPGFSSGYRFLVIDVSHPLEQ